MSASFNEREFELIFNFEFMRRNASALIGTPIIPSQRMEGVLGYDVEFLLRNGHFTKSLFLQHKVSGYVEHKGGTNSSIWNCYNGPYYRFPVGRLEKTRQHNLLVELAEKGEDVYYCAPVFVGFSNLQSYFIKMQVMDNSRFFDPEEMGMIADFNQHYVSFDPTGSFGFFHSESRKLKTVNKWTTLVDRVETRQVNLEYAQSLQLHLTDCIKSIYKAPPSVPETVNEKGTVMVISYILRRYFNVEWLILP